MRAVVWRAPNTVAVEEVEEVELVEPTDAILRLTTAALCGSDVHGSEGRAPVEEAVFGHENLGFIESLGDAARTIHRRLLPRRSRRCDRGGEAGSHPGQGPVKRYNGYLRDHIAGGLARPSVIVSHRLLLEAAPDAYDKFDRRVDGYTTVLLTPDLAA